MDINRWLWPKYARTYDMLLHSPLYQDLTDEVIDHLDLDSASSFLNAGCGTGNLEKEITSRSFKSLKQMKAIDFEFRPGPNFIILYAHNLGYTPPNTASIMVDDGTKKQSLQLRSNLRNCGKLTIRLE